MNSDTSQDYYTVFTLYSKSICADPSIQDTSTTVSDYTMSWVSYDSLYNNTLDEYCQNLYTDDGTVLASGTVDSSSETPSQNVDGTWTIYINDSNLLTQLRNSSTTVILSYTLITSKGSYNTQVGRNLLQYSGT